MLFKPSPSQIEEVRAGAMQDGHDAKRAGCFIPNPHMPGSAFYEAWRDGYDLGVLTAKIDMMAEEKVVDIGLFA